jgi:RND family efflux transporter MFP subunit/putative MATE family efflux protein
MLTKIMGGTAVSERILTGPIIATMLSLSAPMVVVLVAQTMVGIAETYYVGRLGTDALAGAALVLPLSMLMTMMANGGIGGGVASAVARAIGSGRGDDADALVLHAIVLALIFGAAFTAGAILAGPRLYLALGGRAGVLDAATTYSTFVFASAIPTWITNLMAAALRGVGNVRVPALVTMVGAVVLIPMSPLLIFGFGPVPAFGLAGAGIALMLYYVVATLCLGLYLASGRGGLTLRTGPLRWRLFAEILKVGLVSAIGTLVANLTVVVVTGVVGRFGADAIAGYGAASRLDYVQIPFLFGLGTAVVTMVGINVGAGQPGRARRIAWTGAVIGASACEIVGLAAAGFPDSWTGIFSRDPAVLAVGATYLHRVAPAYGAVGLGMLLYFAAQGTGRMLVPFVAGVSRLAVAAGLGWAVVAWFGADLSNLFLCVTGGAAVFGAVNAAGFLLGRNAKGEPQPSAAALSALRRRRFGPRLALGLTAFFSLVAVGFVAAVAVAGRTRDVSREARLPVVRTVLVAPASPGHRRFTGVVHARYESALGFRVGGKIAERLVDTGQRIRKGQVLMRLDATDYVLALEAAHQAVAAARAAAVQAASDEKRRRALVGQGWVTAQAYEQNKALADSASAQLLSALSRESQAADQADYAVLRADSDGVVMETLGEPGQVVTEGQTVVRLAQDGPREAEVYLPEGEVRKAGDQAIASLYVAPDVIIPARLREMSAIADPLTRTYRARYVLAGHDEPLGATVTVRLENAPQGRRTFAVPSTAVFDEGRGTQVWVVDAATSTVVPRQVEVIALGEEDAVVTGDLAIGTRIVAMGAHLLKTGDKIDVETPRTETAGR